jgi:hypothetical protein
VAQHLLAEHAPHGLEQLSVGDFLALSKVFKLSRKLGNPFMDLGVIKSMRPSSQCRGPSA